MERGEADTPREPTPQGEPVQARLPLDLDAPIPFELTARARRAVAPNSLPPLEVVADPAAAYEPAGALEAVEDPNDTRPARARALRRAGMSVSGIAAELDVEGDLVTAWIDTVEPVASARRRLRSVDGGRVARPRALKEAAEAERARQRHDEARSRAREELAAELDTDGDRFIGLGMLVGAANVDDHAVLVRTSERAVAVAAARWLQRHLVEDASRLRVILRIAPQAPGDVARHAWAEALDVPVDRVTTARWRSAPDAGAVEVTIRLADPDAAGRFAGWRDGLLDALGDPESGD